MPFRPPNILLPAATGMSSNVLAADPLKGAPTALLGGASPPMGVTAALGAGALQTDLRVNRCGERRRHAQRV